MTLRAPSIDQRQQADTASSASRLQRAMHWLRLHHWVAALASYTVFTLALTFPLILHLGDSIMGPVLYGDSLWYTWYPYAFRQALAAGQDPSTTHLMYALLPNIPLFAASDLNGAVGALLLSFMVPLAVFNLLMLSTFIIAGFTTYLLVNEFVPNRWAAFIAGCMYTYSTYHFYRVISGLSLTSAMGWMPLVAWRVFAFYRRPTWRNAIFMGLSLTLLPLSDMYTTVYFLPPFALVFVAGLLVGNRAWLIRPQNLLRTAVALALTLAITLPLLASSLQTSPAIQASIAQKLVGGTGVQHFSANVAEYFLPSARNPIFGSLTNHWYSRMAPGISEETAGYLGLVALALAALGVLVTRMRPRAMYFWVAFGCFEFVLSLGPALQVAGKTFFRLPFYGWLYNWPMLNGFRAPNRMAPMVLLAVCVLAAYGIVALFARVRLIIAARSQHVAPFRATQLQRLGVLALGILLIGASLSENILFSFPYPFAYVPVPTIYQQMAADPVPGLVLTLPIYPKGLDMYYQTIYHRGLVTGYPIRTTYPMIRTFENIPDISLFDFPDSPVPRDPDADAHGELHDVFPLQETLLQGLQRDHIRYVVLRSDTTGFTGAVFPPVHPWMKPLLEHNLGVPIYDNQAEGLTVWRIDPAPVDPNIIRFTMGDGWRPGLELANDQIVRAILQDAELHVSVPHAMTTHLTLRVLAVAAPRTLAVSVNGAVMKTQVFNQAGSFQTVDVGVVSLHAGDNVLHFASTQPCVDPGADYPATLDPTCHVFSLAALQMLPPQG